MAAEKITRKDLKEPDEFISWAAKTLDWIQNNWKIVSAAVAGLIVLVVLIQLFVWFSENKEKEASRQLVQALRAVMGEGQDALFVKAPSAVNDPEKIQKALSELEKFEQQHSSARTSKLGRYFRGELLRRQGKFEEAMKSFRDFIDYYGEDNEFSGYAMEGIGACLEAQGKLREALAEYEKLARKSYNVEPDRALYHQARVQLQLGEREKAKDLFKTVLDKYPDSTLRQEIQNRLAFLELNQDVNPADKDDKAENSEKEGGGKG